MSGSRALTPASAKPEIVYLVDASIYIFQAHFSPYVECTDNSGNNLSALYGYAQFLLQFLRRIKPSHIAIALDESLFCGFRHQLCPDYKSNRELPDENLAMQLKGCAEISAILGLSTFSSTVYEADDIIGTLATRVRHESRGDAAIHIVSRDKDLAQLLVSERDCLWDYSGSRKRFSADIIAEYGVSPSQLPDYLGLVGDSVDCIRGVPGVGPVKAKELLGRFNNLNGVYRNLHKVAALPLRGAVRLTELLSEHRELAELSKLLATIVCNVSDPKEKFSRAKLSALQPSRVNLKQLGEFLRSYDFVSRDRDRIQFLSEQLSKA